MQTRCKMPKQLKGRIAKFIYVILKAKTQHQRCGKSTTLQNNFMLKDYSEVFTNIHATSHKRSLQVPSKPDHRTSARSCLPLHPGQRGAKSSIFTVSKNRWTVHRWLVRTLTQWNQRFHMFKCGRMRMEQNLGSVFSRKNDHLFHMCVALWRWNIFIFGLLLLKVHYMHIENLK